MKTKKPAYDSKCLELAEYFCQDDPRHKKYTSDLAEMIQDCIEDFLRSVDYELNEDQLNE